MLYRTLTDEMEQAAGHAITDGAVISGPYLAGLLLVAARALRDVDSRVSDRIAAAVATDEDEAPRAKPSRASKPAGERKRAARGLPPCKMGGRHTWNLQGWCSKCGEVHRDGKVQTQVPGSDAAAPPAEGGAA